MGNISDGAKILVTLGNIGKNAGTGDWSALGLGIFSDLGQIAKLYLKNKGSDNVKKIMGGQAEIIEWTIFVISLLELMNGFGGPDKGTQFATGQDKFDLAYERLAQAYPSDKWQGSAADAYARQNELQQNLAEEMSAIDKAMKSILTKQAEQLTDTRRYLTYSKDGLTGAIFIALWLYSLPVTGPLKSVIFQITVSGTAMAVVGSRLNQMSSDAAANQKAVLNEVTRYNAVTAGSKASAPPPAQARTATPVGSARSGFTAGMSGLAGAAGESPDPGARVAARTGATTRFGGDGLHDEPAEAVAAGAPGAPVFPAPTSAQATAQTAQPAKPSGQAATLSGQAATARQGRPAPHDTGDGDGAAAGADNAERAPVDVAATGSAQAPAAGPAERTA